MPPDQRHNFLPERLIMATILAFGLAVGAGIGYMFGTWN